MNRVGISMESEPKTQIVEQVAIVVVCRDDHVLVGIRPDGVPFAGLAEFPGGRLQPGESWEEAARRETLEETGLSVRVEALLGTVSTRYEDRILELRFFAASPVSPAASPREPFRWIRRDALRADCFPPANRTIIEQIQKGHGQ